MPHDGSSDSRAKDIADLIASLINKGAKPGDLSGIYLVKVDLAKSKLPHTNFDNSILSWSNFTGADLNGSSFDGAELEGVRFIGSALRGAQLTFRSGPDRNDYYIRRFKWAIPGGQGQVLGPDFDCADLRDSNFDGRSIFLISSYTLKDYLFPPHFVKARLDGTDFRLAEAYGGFSSLEPSYASRWFPGPSRMIGNVEAYSASIGEDVWPANSPFEFELQLMSKMFFGSTWQSAKFPGAVRKLFDRLPPSPPDTILYIGDVPVVGACPGLPQ